MQQGQQQATKLVLQLPRAVTILRGQPAVVEEEQQQADQQQVKVKVQAAVLQAAEKELPAALKVEAAVDNLKAYSEAVNRSSTITTTTDREPLGLFLFLILLYV
jgi:phage-related tail fiber protein